MSGGGGGSTQRPIKPNSDGGSGFDCESVTITTNLSSPVPEVLKKISPGTVLNLEIEPKSQAINAMHEGEVAGSISHYYYSDLIDCIEAGHSYIAKVKRIKQGLCEVSIYHR